MSVTRKEILISDAALGYLQSSEIEQAFCGECPWNDSRQGRELFTGLPTPPSQECPADFDLDRFLINLLESGYKPANEESKTILISNGIMTSDKEK